MAKARRSSTVLLLTLAVVAVFIAAWFGFGHAPEGESANSSARASEPPARGAIALAAPEDDPGYSEAANVSDGEPSAGSAERSAVEAQYAQIDVRVLSEAGVPQQGVRVMAHPVDTPVGWTATIVDSSRALPGDVALSEERGRVTLLVPVGVEHVVLPQNRHAVNDPIRVQALDAGARRVLDLIVKSEPFVFYLRAIDAQSREPIHRAVAYSESEGPARAFSDVQGFARIEAERDLAAFVRVESDSHSPAIVKLVPGHEAQQRALEVALWRNAELDVEVRGPRGGVPGVKVIVKSDTPQWVVLNDPRADYRGTPQRWEQTSGNSGLVGFASLPPRERLVAWCELGSSGLPQQVVTLVPGEVRRLKFEVPRMARIAGTLTNSRSAPLGDVEIWRVDARVAGNARELGSVSAPAATTRTNLGGDFAFEDVPLGEWLVGIAPGEPRSNAGGLEAALAPSARRVWIAFWDSDARVDLVSEVDLFISGVVLDPNGRPTSVSLLAEGADSGSFAYGLSDARTGGFSIGPLQAGLHDLRTLGAGGWADAAPLQVAAGASGVELRLRESGSMRIVVSKRDGQRTSATLLLQALDGDQLPKTLDAPTGEALVRGLLPGAYSIVARAESGTAAIRERIVVDAGESPPTVDMTLEPGAWLVLSGASSSETQVYEVRSRGVLVYAGGVESSFAQPLCMPAGEFEVRSVPTEGRSAWSHSSVLGVGETLELEVGR